MRVPWPMSRDGYDELLGAYSLHSTEIPEGEEIKAHLAGCPRCRAEVKGHEEVAALLAEGGWEVPSGLWSKIARSIAEQSQPLPVPGSAARPGHVPGPTARQLGPSSRGDADGLQPAVIADSPAVIADSIVLSATGASGAGVLLHRLKLLCRRFSRRS